MNDIISIHKELVRLSKSLAEAVNEFRDAAIGAAEMRSAYDVLWAQAILQTPDDATQKVKEAIATNRRLDQRFFDVIRDLEPVLENLRVDRNLSLLRKES